MASRRAACRITGHLPLVTGYIEVGAQRPPHLTGVDTGLNGLLRGPAAESAQHMVNQQRGTPHRAELRLDEFVEFGQPHAINLIGRLVTHPYRIGDPDQALSSPSRRLPVGRRGQHTLDLRHQSVNRQRPDQTRTPLSHNTIR